MLNSYSEPMKSFLERYLYKSYIKYQTEHPKSKDSNVLMEKIIVWLIEVFNFINNFIQKHGLSEYSLSK